MAFSPDGKWVATGNRDKTGNTARVFESATGKEMTRMTYGGQITAVAFSPDGKRVAIGSRDNTARVFETASGKEVSAAPRARWFSRGSGVQPRWDTAGHRQLWKTGGPTRAKQGYLRPTPARSWPAWYIRI